MGAAGLDDTVVRGRLGGQGVAQLANRGQQAPDHLLGDRDMHRCREGVVRRLTTIHMIVRMHRLLAAEFPTGQFDRAIRYHFVRIHVRLGARAGLEHHQRKVLIELAVNDFLRRPLDQAGHIRRQFAQLGVGARRGQFEDAQRTYHRALPAKARNPNREMMHRPLGLRPPVAIGRDRHTAHRIGFLPYRLVLRRHDACSWHSNLECQV